MSTFKTGDVLLRHKVLQGGFFVPKGGVIKVLYYISSIDAYTVEIIKNCDSNRPGAKGNMRLQPSEFKKIAPKVLKRKT